MKCFRTGDKQQLSGRETENMKAVEKNKNNDIGPWLKSTRQTDRQARHIQMRRSNSDGSAALSGSTSRRYVNNASAAANIRSRGASGIRSFRPFSVSLMPFTSICDAHDAEMRMLISYKKRN